MHFLFEILILIEKPKMQTRVCSKYWSWTSEPRGFYNGIQTRINESAGNDILSWLITNLTNKLSVCSYCFSFVLFFHSINMLFILEKINNT